MSDFYERYYSQLNGAKIVRYNGIVQDDFIHVAFPQFEVKLADGTKIQLEVSCDEEGNGAGYLFGLPIPPE